MDYETAKERLLNAMSGSVTVTQPSVQSVKPVAVPPPASQNAANMQEFMAKMGQLGNNPLTRRGPRRVRK